MTRRDFAAAIPILAACQQGGYSEDIARMLQFAREELSAQRRTELFTRHAEQSQAALRKADYEAVIQLLEPVLFEEDEPRLRAMLEQARTLLQESQQKQEEQSATLQKILAEEDS